MQIKIRPIAPGDGAAAAEVFFDAVHNATADVYTVEQRTAWAGSAPDLNGWLKRFERVEGFSAEVDGSMVGFMTIDADGYIDLAFVRSGFAGQGIGQSLYEKIEAYAVSRGIVELTTEASKKAKPFFMRMGWRAAQEQTVMKKTISLTNFKMSKSLEAKS